ncbi:hypothetical protein FRB96_007200 [Tulasnella sp. 330]|nr:hypothetical protein FRB96_007200 [Tulasnella sp. 330]
MQMDTYPSHEDSLESIFQDFLQVVRRHAKTQGNRSPSSNHHKYDIAAQQLMSLETCAAGFGAKLQPLLSTHRRALNALLPIYRIPSEILAEILDMSLVLWSERDRETYQRHLNTFRCVSAAWRALIDNSPLLWATVSCSDPLHIVRDALLKSKGCPLEVIYRTRLVTRPKIAKFLGMTLQHVQRWKTLDVYEINQKDTEELLNALAGLNAPKLQELSLVDTGGPQGSTKDPFNGRTPQLRRIKLSRSLLIPWSSAVLSNLYVLHIIDFHFEGPSTNQVDSMLRASPMLVELTLENLSQKDDDAPSMIQAHPVELFSLRTLTMCRLTPKLASHILGNIQIPHCETISVNVNTSPKVAYSPNESFLHSARTIAGGSDSAEVELGVDVFYLTCWKQDKLVLGVLISGKGWEFNAAASFLQQLDASLDLDVVIDTNLPDKSDLGKILDLYPSLQGARTLRLSQHRPFTHDRSNTLIGKLGVATTVDRAKRWPLPLLEMLRVRSPSLEAEGLLGVIRARLKAKVEPPAKLRSLELAGKLESHFSELERTLGEGVVCCYEPGSYHYIFAITESEGEDENEDEGEGKEDVDG